MEWGIPYVHREPDFKCRKHCFKFCRKKAEFIVPKSSLGLKSPKNLLRKQNPSDVFAALFFGFWLKGQSHEMGIFMSLRLMQYSDLTLILARRGEIGFWVFQSSICRIVGIPLGIPTRSLLRPRSNHICQQKPYPSGDPVPLRLPQRTWKYFSLKKSILCEKYW